MRCYNARRCGFLVAASLEYVAVEQNDGSNFAFEYGDMAMLHYRSQDILASTLFEGEGEGSNTRQREPHRRRASRHQRLRLGIEQNEPARFHLGSLRGLTSAVSGVRAHSTQPNKRTSVTTQAQASSIACCSEACSELQPRDSLKVGGAYSIRAQEHRPPREQGHTS